LIHPQVWGQVFNIGAIHIVGGTYIINPSTLHQILDISKKVATIPLLTTMSKTAGTVGAEATCKSTSFHGC
jgi:hypothetical protein